MYIFYCKLIKTKKLLILIQLNLLDRSPPLQVLLDLCSVLPVIPVQLLVEFGVPLVDVVDIGVVVVRPPPRVLVPLGDLVLETLHHVVHSLRPIFVQPVDDDVGPAVERLPVLLLVLLVFLHVFGAHAPDQPVVLSIGSSLEI
jgi:hypothetical protein